MPNSKHRKRQIVANRRQLERAKKRITLENVRAQEREKENQSPRRQEVLNKKDDQLEDGTGWLTGLGSLYTWCQSGVVQVRVW